MHAELCAGNQWNEGLMVGGVTLGGRFNNITTDVVIHYFQLDHLGTVSVLTDETGRAVIPMTIGARAGGPAAPLIPPAA
jgi:hypothetical protein